MLCLLIKQVKVYEFGSFVYMLVETRFTGVVRINAYSTYGSAVVIKYKASFSLTTFTLLSVSIRECTYTAPQE